MYGKKVILVGGEPWTATNTTSSYLHLSDQIFAFGQGGPCVAGKLDHTVRGQTLFGLYDDGGDCNEFGAYIKNKNSHSHAGYDWLSFRDQHLVKALYDHLKVTTLTKENTWCIRTTRDPYDLFCAFLWRKNDIPTLEMAHEFIEQQLIECSNCFKVKEAGYRFLNIDLISKREDHYTRIMEFIGIPKSSLQIAWENKDIALNRSGRRKMYLKLRDKYRDNFSLMFDILRNHPVNRLS
jgi:hypothetical protein